MCQVLDLFPTISLFTCCVCTVSVYNTVNILLLKIDLLMIFIIIYVLFIVFVCFIYFRDIFFNIFYTSLDFLSYMPFSLLFKIFAHNIYVMINHSTFLCFYVCDINTSTQLCVPLVLHKNVCCLLCNFINVYCYIFRTNHI